MANDDLLFKEIDLFIGNASRNQLLGLLAGLLSREAIVRALIDEEPTGSSSSSSSREVQR